MAHTIDSSTRDLAAQCGSLQKASTADDLLALHSVFSTIGWPTTSSYSYLSQTKGTKNYCAVNQSSGSENCTIDAGKTAGFATCAQ